MEYGISGWKSRRRLAWGQVTVAGNAGEVGVWLCVCGMSPGREGVTRPSASGWQEQGTEVCRARPVSGMMTELVLQEGRPVERPVHPHEKSLCAARHSPPLVRLRRSDASSPAL